MVYYHVVMMLRLKIDVLLAHTFPVSARG